MPFSSAHMLAFVAQALALTQVFAQTPTPIPAFAFTYAPYLYLAPTENYWPSDITTHLANVYPSINGTAAASGVTLANLSSYPSNTFLTSKTDVDNTNTPQQDWIVSAYGKPDSTGLSAAAATIIAVNKPGGIVDVFYFAFYSYNFGNSFLDITFGNHVGDWEHTMVRFVNGAPTTVYISTHSDGSAYNYASMPKNGVRPIAYIAAGDHANYGTSGSQPYPVPVIGPIVDHTGQGAFWDSTLNFRGYWFDNSTQTFTAAPGAGAGGQEQLNETPDWLSFQGAWGDDTPSTDILKNEQYCIFSECHYTAGPTGPIAKNLGRTSVCQSGTCTISNSVKKVFVSKDINKHLTTLGNALLEAQDRGFLDNVTHAATTSS